MGPVADGTSGAPREVLRAQEAIQEAEVVGPTLVLGTRPVLSFLGSDQALRGPWSCRRQCWVRVGGSLGHLPPTPAPACVCGTGKCHTTAPTPTALAHSGQCSQLDCLCPGWEFPVPWLFWLPGLSLLQQVEVLAPAATPPPPNPRLHGTGLGPGRCPTGEYASVARAREGRAGAQGPPVSRAESHPGGGQGWGGSERNRSFRVQGQEAPGASGHPHLLSHPITLSYNHGG